MEWLISELVTLAGLAYPFLQVLVAWRYRGRWFLWSLVPLLIMVPLAIHAGFAFAAGSSLWPILLVLAAPVAFLYLVGLAVVKSSLS